MWMLLRSGTAAPGRRGTRRHIEAAHGTVPKRAEEAHGHHAHSRLGAHSHGSVHGCLRCCGACAVHSTHGVRLSAAAAWRNARAKRLGLTNAKAELCGRTERNGQGRRGGGGEYEPQHGFGWTNGVALQLLKWSCCKNGRRCNRRHTTCSMQRAACRMQQATRDIHHAPAALVLAASVAHPAGAVPDARQHLRHRAVHS